ncbi:uncharacterized protein LOC118749503 [Rhagoletis pomonella]|uniref:uncharacterized protein LOC118749503 n=1 Tax=Rhagoletis pomonella TaxID=28610 RepID=UPI001780A07C|nr:uncharacterized protein LOC118749503 [Rhagoletis pomonella]
MNEELTELWGKAKAAFEQCLQSLKAEDEVEAVKAKYSATFKDYLSCKSCITECMRKFSGPSLSPPHYPSQAAISANNLQLPPCDTEVFRGDYSSWPTFRDLFTAIYFSNTRLSNVEKLFHLLRKTSGEAKEIVSKSPLTNQGFDLAWANLKATFENKRVLVNGQLKLLFALPVIRTESASALKNIQRSINGCLAAADFGINHRC